MLNDQEREELFRPICQDMMGCLFDAYSCLKNENTCEQEWLLKCRANTVLFTLYHIASKRFISADGDVYEMYLVKNSTEEERFKWVKHINGKDSAEKEGPFKDYIDGKCEINEVFDKISDDFSKGATEICEEDNRKRNSETAKTYSKISRIIACLRDYETYSDKKLNELTIELSEMINGLNQESMINRFMIFYCKEIQKAYDHRDIERLDELQKDWRKHRNYVWSKISE